MSFKCSNRCKIVFGHLRLSLQAVNTVFMRKMCLKYQYASPVACACAHVFRKRPGCALIGTCALIRTKTVFLHQLHRKHKELIIYAFFKAE